MDERFFVKRRLLATAVTAILLLPAANSYADSEAQLEYQHNQADQLENEISYTIRKVRQVQEALWAYYATNRGFPPNLPSLSSGTDPFFVGTFDSSLGALSGSPNSTGFLIAVNIGSGDSYLGQRLSAQLNGTYSKSTGVVVVPVLPPQGAALVSNMLSRLDDTSGSNLNTMKVDLEMGETGVSQFQITDVKDIFGITAEVTSQLDADELDVDAVTAANITTDKATLASLVTNNAIVDDGVANTFIVNGTLTSTNTTGADTGGIATINDLKSDSIKSVSANISTLNVSDKLTGDNLDYIQGSIVDNLTTVEMVVNGDTNAPKVKADVISARSGSSVNVDAATQFSDIVTADRMTILGHINQLPSATTTFNQTTTISNIISNGDAKVNSLSTDNLKVNRDSIINGKLTVNGQTTIDGLMNGDSFTFSRNLQAADIRVNDDVSFGNGLNVGGKVVSNRSGSNLYENGQRLEDRYLQKGQKAVNTERLDGLRLSSFAQLDESNTFTQSQTFNNISLSNASLRVGGFLIADSSGRLYERGTAISSIYETKANVNSQKQQAVNQLNSLRTELINKANSVTNIINGSHVSNIESKHAANTSNINTLLASSNTLKNASATTKANALTAKNNVSSLVNSANSAYGKSHTFQTNKVISKSQSETKTEWHEDPAKSRCEEKSSYRTTREYWALSSGGMHKCYYTEYFVHSFSWNASQNKCEEHVRADGKTSTSCYKVDGGGGGR